MFLNFETYIITTALDSVELLASFEKYFNIQISDQEAEKIGTGQEMVDCIWKHLNISDNDARLKNRTLEKLHSILTANGPINTRLSLSIEFSPFLIPLISKPGQKFPKSSIFIFISPS